jgi:hypothetical protein
MAAAFLNTIRTEQFDELLRASDTSDRDRECQRREEHDAAGYERGRYGDRIGLSADQAEQPEQVGGEDERGDADADPGAKNHVAE